jgi:hypothetical protein
MSVFYSAFNNAMNDFMEDLSSAFPGNVQLGSIASALRMAVKANVRLPHRQFADHVLVPYEPQLRAKDEAFFINNRYSEVDTSATNFVVALKALWKGMSEDDKACTFAHIDTVLKCHDKIQAMLLVGSIPE